MKVWIVKWKGILGDQGLVCVSSTVVMSCQDNWNEKHRPPFNEVRLSKKYRIRMKMGKGWGARGRGSQTEIMPSQFCLKNKCLQCCFPPHMTMHLCWRLSKSRMALQPINVGFYGLNSCPLTNVEHSAHWLTAGAATALGKALYNQEHWTWKNNGALPKWRCSILRRTSASMRYEEKTSLSQVPPHPSLEITWAVCLIGSHIVLMNNNMMWKKGRYRPRERQLYGILLN